MRGFSANIVRYRPKADATLGNDMADIRQKAIKSLYIHVALLVMVGFFGYLLASNGLPQLAGLLGAALFFYILIDWVRLAWLSRQ
jgi:hypothetical protein